MGDAQSLSPEEQLAFAREQFESATDLTVAVEEEFAVLDPETLDLTNRFEELQAAYRELVAMGIAVDSTIAHNVTRSVYFHDPDGNRVELYCDMFEGGGFEEMRTLGPRRDDMDMATGHVSGR